MESNSKFEAPLRNRRIINNKASPYYLKKSKIQYQSIDNIDKRLSLIKRTLFITNRLD